MIEPDFVTEEGSENQEDTQRTYRIEILISHVVLCVLIFWIITFKNILRVSNLVKWNPFQRRFDEKVILLFKKMLVATSIADFLLISSLLFVSLGCYLTYYYYAAFRDPLENDLKCSNAEFLLFVWCLFIAAYCTARHSSVLILLSIPYVPGILVCLWITSIILPMTLYYFILPRVSVPRVEICLDQNQSNADVFILILVAVVVVSSILNVRNCQRLTIWNMHRLKGNRYIKDSRKNELQEFTCAESQSEKGTHVNIDVARKPSKIQHCCQGNSDTTYDMILQVFVAVFGCLPLCFLFWFSRTFQEVNFVVKLLLGGFAYAFLSCWNVGIMKSIWTYTLHYWGFSKIDHSGNDARCDCNRRATKVIGSQVKFLLEATFFKIYFAPIRFWQLWENDLF